jgi:hypothetical protein
MALRRCPVSPMVTGLAVGRRLMSSWLMSCWAGRGPRAELLGPDGLLSQATKAVLETGPGRGDGRASGL